MSLPHGAMSWSEVSERAFTSYSYTQLLCINANVFIFLLQSTSLAVSLKVD